MTDVELSAADGLAWTVARWAAGLPRMTTFAASAAALAGLRVAQTQLGAKLALWGHGGAYDPRGSIALFARARLFNCAPRARLGLPGVLDTLSRGMRLIATPAQVDGAANANLSVIGEWAHPKVALVGTRGLPDATEIHFVMPTHTARQLVARVDFVSTCAANREVPPCLITELGILQWSQRHAVWRLREHRAGVTPNDIQRRTGFELMIDDDVTEMPPPPQAILRALATVDPRRVRDLDFAVSAAERQRMLAALEAAEQLA